jgi:uncharacterized membrane protein required for colicin V production
MKKIINNQLIKMTILLAMLFALCSWQISFIMMAINSNVYMNGAIILAFFGSAGLAMWMVQKLKREITALDSLKELWSDVQQHDKMVAQDPFWKHYRALKAGKVFDHPKVLGHAYDLVSEEIIRTGRMKIGVGTVQTLMHKIEAKLSDDRALINYLSGLLVFMGLIGAFLGLLKMVGSISGIIGSLANASSSGGAAEAFQQMLNDLQKPLSGMATGFASSLFGLFCSLVIGLMGRFIAEGQNALKGEFETLLVGIAQIENSEAPVASTSQLMEGADNKNDISNESIIALSKLGTRTNLALERSNAIMENMAAQQEQNTKAMQANSQHFAAVVAQQTTMQEQIRKITEIGQSMASLKDDVMRFEKSVDEKVSHSINNLAHMIQKTWAQQAESLAVLAKQQADFTSTLGGILQERNQAIQPLHETHKAMEQGLASGFDKVSKVLDITTRSVAISLQQLAQQQASFNQIMTKQASQVQLDGDKLAQKLQLAMKESATGVVQTISEVMMSSNMPQVKSVEAPLAPTNNVREQQQAIVQSVQNEKLPLPPMVERAAEEEARRQLSQQEIDRLASKLYEAARQAPPAKVA